MTPNDGYTASLNPLQIEEEALANEPREETEAEKKNRFDCNRDYTRRLPFEIQGQIFATGCNESMEKCDNARCVYKLHCGYNGLFLNERVKNHVPSAEDEAEWGWYKWKRNLMAGRKK